MKRETLQKRHKQSNKHVFRVCICISLKLPVITMKKCEIITFLSERMCLSRFVYNRMLLWARTARGISIDLYKVTLRIAVC